MTFPEKGTPIPFDKAQEAIIAVAEAYNRAIEQVINNDALKTKLMATVAENVFETMMEGVKDPNGSGRMRDNDHMTLLHNLMGGHE